MSQLLPLPSSPISSPSSSTSPGESFKSSHHEAKKKKKTKKKKSAKQEVNRAVVTPNAPPIGRPFVPPRKVRFPCNICKGDHFLIDYLGIPKFLEVWSKNSYQPTVDPSNIDCEVHGKNGKLRFPSELCKGIHYSHI